MGTYVQNRASVSFSVNQYIFLHFGEYKTFKGKPFFQILDKINTADTFETYFVKIHTNNILPSTSGSFECDLPFWVYDKNFAIYSALYRPINIYIFSSGAPAPSRATRATRAMVYSFMRFLDHTQRRATVGMTPLDK